MTTTTTTFIYGAKIIGFVRACMRAFIVHVLRVLRIVLSRAVCRALSQ